MQFEAIEKQRAHERVVAQIEEGIASGRLVPGDKFPSERELVQQFDISRPTVREGLRVAESLGLIEVRPGHPEGSIVTARYPKGISRVMESLLRGKQANLGHLVELRMLLEGQASFLAALQPSERLEPLRAAYAAMEAATDQKALEAADVSFHEAQGAVSGNPFLSLIIAAMADTIRMSITVGLPSLGWPEAHETALKRHGEILAAIEAGDGPGASAIARQNLLVTYRPLVPDAAERFEALAAQR